MPLALSSRVIAIADETALFVVVPEAELDLSGDDAKLVARTLASLAADEIAPESVEEDVRALLLDVGLLVDDVENDRTSSTTLGDSDVVVVRSLFDADGTRAAMARETGHVVILDVDGATVLPVAHGCVWCARYRLMARRPSAHFERARAIEREEARLVAWPTLLGRQALAEGVARVVAMRAERAFTVDEEGVGRAHALLSHPACPRCRPSPPETREAAVRALAPLLDERGPSAPDPLFDDVFGPLTRGVVSTRGEGFRALPIVQGGIAFASPDGHRSSTQTAAMGSGPDLATREAVLLSELVERYGLRARQPDVEQECARALGGLAVSPSRFALFRDDDRRRFALPYATGSDDDPLDWVWALDLASRAPRLVPFDQVVLERGGDPTKRLVALHVSTGAASHPKPWRAIFSGLREVVERDAAMIAWYKRVALPVVDLPRVLPHALADELRTHLVRRGLRMQVFDLRLDVPMPGVFVVATRDETAGAFEAGAVVVASAMAEDIGQALAHALQELAFHDETLSLFPDPSKDWRLVRYDPASPDEGRGSWWPLYTHYLNPSNARAFDFLRASRHCVGLDDIPPLDGDDDASRVGALVSHIGRVHDEAPCVVDLSTGDMADAGRTTVKVLVPGFVDAASGRQTMRFATARIERAVHGRDALAPGALNDDPHPAM